MEEIDTRKLKPAVQEQIRFQAIRLRKSGCKYKEIEEILGACHTTLCAWYKKYEREGKKSIWAQQRGRKLGSCRTLNPDQEKLIQQMPGSTQTALCFVDKNRCSAIDKGVVGY